MVDIKENRAFTFYFKLPFWIYTILLKNIYLLGVKL